MRQGKISVCLAVLACMSVPALSQGSSACGDTKDYYKAVAACSEVIRAHPKDAANYHMRGKVLERNGDAGQAIADYTKAIELNPAYLPAYNSRALAYTITGDYMRALADATKASELEANKAPVVKVAPLANNRRQARARPAVQTKRRVLTSASSKKAAAPEHPPLNPVQMFHRIGASDGGG
jgi:tetratricopeptide (TPR) repeat protein